MNARPKNLKNSAFKAGSWTLIGHILTQAMRFGGNLILTRLLVPEMFGVMAVVNVIVVAITMVSDVGLLPNIIQSKNAEAPAFLNTAWTVQILRGTAITFMLLLLAVAIYFANQYGLIPNEMVYANKDLPFLLAALASGTFVGGFNSIYLYLMSRNLQLGRLVFIEIISQLLGLLLIIYIAWQYRSIYALVSGSFFTNLTKMVLSHWIVPGRCRLAWDKDSREKIVNFGKWIMLSSFSSTLFAQGDRLLLGLFITPALLGIYTVAYFLAFALRDILNRLLLTVFLPVLSDTVRYRPERLQPIYYKIRYRIDAVTFFTAGFIFSVAKPLIGFLYDDRYLEAGWMLQILALALPSMGFTLANQCFLAHGRSSFIALLSVIQTVTLFVSLPLCYKLFGMNGALWAIALTPYASVLVSSVLMKMNYFFHIGKELIMLPMVFLGYYLGKFIAEIDWLGVFNFLVSSQQWFLR